MLEGGKAFAVGSQIFVDLWALLGLIPVPCTSPEDSARVFAALSGASGAFVAVESEWFDGLPEGIKKRLEQSADPVWIKFPSCESGEMR